MSARHREALHLYACVYCNYWHIGHMDWPELQARAVPIGNVGQSALPDEGEAEIDGGDQARVEGALLVDALMGWDGDRCSCAECACPRFRDDADDTLCGACLVGDHWRANG